jgi:tRNA (guanine37-N1)-methyltransferase
VQDLHREKHGEHLARGLTYRDLLSDILPRDVFEKLPRSFDIVGDIAIIRIDERELLKYGGEISNAIMKIHKRVRAVYAKGPARGSLRIQQLEHLGGERRTETIYKENGLRFSVDIAKMYVNPRLGSERLRIAMDIKDGELVLDMFSSYGAFAINIARIRRCLVVASDINSDAVTHMKRSIYMNKLLGEVMPLVSDANNMPLRGVFTTVIADNPTNILESVEAITNALVKGGRAYIYALTDEPEAMGREIERSSGFRLAIKTYYKVKEYSPRLNIYRYLAIRV